VEENQLSSEEAQNLWNEEAAKLVVSKPLRRDTEVVREFVCQIHSARNIEVRALERGYLETVKVAEGQQVKEGEDERSGRWAGSHKKECGLHVIEHQEGSGI
jgi:multidrug efflux pump subunit AcrA (membrane-fusion protein)